MSNPLDNTLDDLAVLAPAPATDRRRLRLPWHLRVLEAATSYLPVLLMGALALGTWWLVNVSPPPEVQREPAPPRHEPDYTMQHFTVQRFASDGRLRVQIEGAEMRHYPDTDTLEIDRVTIRAWSPAGQPTVATAERAIANGDASEVQLLGGARVVREGDLPSDRIEFEDVGLEVNRRPGVADRRKQPREELRAAPQQFDAIAPVDQRPRRQRRTSPLGRPMESPPLFPPQPLARRPLPVAARHGMVHRGRYLVRAVRGVRLGRQRGRQRKRAEP